MKRPKIFQANTKVTETSKSMSLTIYRHIFHQENVFGKAPDIVLEIKEKKTQERKRIDQKHQ